MAVPALVQQAENFNNAGGTSLGITWGSNTTSGNLIIVGVSWTTAGINVNSVTDSQGNVYQSARAKTAHSGNADFYQIWYAENITGGTTPTVTVNFSGSATFRLVGIHEVSGCLKSGALDQTAGATANSGATIDPGNVTTTLPDEYLFSGGTSFGAQTFTQGANWAARTTPSDSAFTQDRIVNAIGTYATSFTQSDSSKAWIAQAATFKGPTLAATGFPSISGTVTQTLGTTATTTPVVNLPSGCVAGETIFVLVRNAVAGAIGWPDGTWNEMFDASSDAADDQMALAWRKADGTEGASITLSSGNGKFAALAWRVAGAIDPSVRAPELSTVAIGTSTTPNPTACTPTGGTKNYLWIWVGGWAGEQTSPPASNPTSYSLNVTGADSGTAGVTTTNCRVAIAARQLNAGSEDPASWTISVSDSWTAYTLAVHPANLPPPPQVIQNAVHHAASW